MDHVYVCIDLKSFYASVECRERGLDPLTTNLVVADRTRTEKTVCLAVTPSLKAYGLSGRSRLYEVVEKVKKVNYERKQKIHGASFKGKSCNDIELTNNKYLELDFIAAPPRMAHYMKYSSKIYNIYLKYVSKEDIFVYSIDEIFCDVTKYLKYYNMTPRELVTKMIHDVYLETGITATSGIGPNLFIAKVAMDVVAKHAEPDKYGVRIAELDIRSFRETLWEHKPITDIWRIGKGTADRLKKYNIETLGDIARTSIKNEDFLYKLFGVNAELLIDHAWGYESATIESVKAIKPIAKSLSSGQVLHEPYNYEKTKLIIKEMSELVSLDLVSKKFITDQLVLDIHYDVSNIKDKRIDETAIDHYGRVVPKPSHGTLRLDFKTSSTNIITDGFLKLYEQIVHKNLLIRKLNLTVANLSIDDNKEQVVVKQLDLFNDTVLEDKINKQNKEDKKNEKIIQSTILDIKKKYGKNSILKGMNLSEGGTTIERNTSIGGHKA